MSSAVTNGIMVSTRDSNTTKKGDFKATLLNSLMDFESVFTMSIFLLSQSMIFIRIRDF
jgi:hypothetical protein